MHRRRLPSPSRWALWGFVVALLLKAAVPGLAAAAASAQGRALVEICTVYGVATVPHDGGEPASRPDAGLAHGDEGCALGGLLALSAPPGVATSAAATAFTAAPSQRLVHPPLLPPDAASRWAARQRHGPPALA